MLLILLLLLLPSLLTLACPIPAHTHPIKILISLPTIPRYRLDPDESHYLLRTLSSLASQLDSAALVLVVHPRLDLHEAFGQAQVAWSADPRFVFCQQAPASPDSIVPAVTPSLSLRIIQQTLDSIATLRLAQTLIHNLNIPFHLVMEDDFVFCPDAWSLITQALSAAPPSMSALRVSFGFNGYVLPAPSLPVLIEYLTQHAARRPPDHLAVELFARETPQARALFNSSALWVLRENVMEHIGKASTLRPRRDASPELKCGATLGPPVLFDVEAYDLTFCEGRALCEAGLAARAAEGMDDPDCAVVN